MLNKIFRALSAIFSSRSMHRTSALRALRLVTRLAVRIVSIASYELFKTIVASDNLTDQHWEAARLAAHGAFERNVELTPPTVGEPREILKFLDYHLGLQGAGEDHSSSIALALEAILIQPHDHRVDRQRVEYIRKFNCASPSFARGIRSIIHPDAPLKLRWLTAGLIALISDQWFGSPAHDMEPEEMSEFCEHIAVLIIDDVLHVPFVQSRGVTILFGMLQSPEWRKCIVTRFWGMLAYCGLADEEQESFRWCLKNAIELLEFTRGLPDGEGLKWWYGTLWFNYDKLDTTVQDEVKRIARDMSLGDGLSDLNLYLNLIGQGVAGARQEVDELSDEDRLDKPAMKLRARLIALEGNHYRLARITGRG